MISRLNTRERIFVFCGLGVLLLILVWLLLINPYFAAMTGLDRRIAGLQRSLSKAVQMQEQITGLRQQLVAVGNQRRGSRPLFSDVENLTEQTGVRDQLLSMRPQPATTQGEFRQQLVEIRLEKLRLAQLVKLLHAVEYRSGGIQVKALRVKPRFEDRSSLDVNMTLMTLEKP